MNKSLVMVTEVEDGKSIGSDRRRISRPVQREIIKLN